jgi:23S rRNA (cytidine1920-2'-O)/16S rRNA (cytidine1409-2'-O)-methyltransferase
MAGDESPDRRYASRGGIKLAAALERFSIDPAGWRCVDLGCSTGGFTDCLLQAGAQHVWSVDTAYGQLAWELRQDPQVTVLERSNALHVEPPAEAARMCRLATIDLGWTPQLKSIAAALNWLQDGGFILTLVKPHYESKQHRLDDAHALSVVQTTLAEVINDSKLGPVLHLRDVMESPIRGAKGGNPEWIAWFEVACQLGPGAAGSASSKQAPGSVG